MNEFWKQRAARFTDPSGLSTGGRRIKRVVQVVPGVRVIAQTVDLAATEKALRQYLQPLASAGTARKGRNSGQIKAFTLRASKKSVPSRKPAIAK
jgi:hypothetical protein